MIQRFCAVFAVAATLAAFAVPASASTGDERVVVRSVVICHPVRCHQTKEITTYHHGELPITRIKYRSRPAESRTFIFHAAPAWTRWHLIGVRFGLPPRT